MSAFVTSMFPGFASVPGGFPGGLGVLGAPVPGLGLGAVGGGASLRLGPPLAGTVGALGGANTVDVLALAPALPLAVPGLGASAIPGLTGFGVPGAPGLGVAVAESGLAGALAGAPGLVVAEAVPPAPAAGPARVQFGVVAQAAEAGLAVVRVEQVVQRMVAALRTGGVPGAGVEAVQTSGVTVTPVIGSGTVPLTPLAGTSAVGRTLLPTPFSPGAIPFAPAPLAGSPGGNASLVPGGGSLDRADTLDTGPRVVGIRASEVVEATVANPARVDQVVELGVGAVRAFGVLVGVG